MIQHWKSYLKTKCYLIHDISILWISFDWNCMTHAYLSENSDQKRLYINECWQKKRKHLIQNTYCQNLNIVNNLDFNTKFAEVSKHTSSYLSDDEMYDSWSCYALYLNLHSVTMLKKTKYKNCQKYSAQKTCSQNSKKTWENSYCSRKSHDQ